MFPDPHLLPGDGDGAAATTFDPTNYQPLHLPQTTDPSCPSPDLSIHGGSESQEPRVETERPGDREALHPTLPASPPLPVPTTTKLSSLPLLLAHPQKLGPATPAIPTDDDVEEELLDYGDEEDPEEIDVGPAASIDGGEDAETPDLQATSSSATPVAEPGGPGDADRHVDGKLVSASCSPPVLSAGTPAAPAKLKSVLVIPDRAPAPPSRQRKPVWKRLDLSSAADQRRELGEPSGVNVMQFTALSPEWQRARRKHWWRKPAAMDCAMTEIKQKDTTTLSKTGAARASSFREAFIRRLDGRCFRCLASDHRVAQCRDPVRCLSCNGVGHISRSCPSRRHRPVSAQLRARLQFPPQNIHSRIAFPPLHHQPTAKAPTHVPELHPPAHIDYRSIAHEVANTLSIQLHVPRNDIHVTSLRPGMFVVAFQLPAKRVDNCSPPADSQVVAADKEPMDRGRSWSRSPSRSARNRDYLCHASDDWERRRSRSPDRRDSSDEPRNNSGLFMGHDPLVDYHGHATLRPPDMMQDPMTLEASIIAPSSAPQSSVAGEIVGPGVQLPVVDGSQAEPEHEVEMIVDVANRMDFDTTGAHELELPEVDDSEPVEEGGHVEEAATNDFDIFAGLFCELPPPLLPTPTAPAPSMSAPRKRRSKKDLVSTRSSTRLAAKSSGVPVAQRAQYKLMKELSFIDSDQQQHAPDKAVADYIDQYGDDLPEKAVEAIMTATRMRNKKLTKALAAIVQEADAVEVET